MAAYRTHGKSSSSKSGGATDLSSVCNILTKLALKSRVKKLVDALGVDADLHIVGGAIREAIIKKNYSAQTDIDFATCFTPEQVIELLDESQIRTILTGARHGTVTAVIEDANLEITTFRSAGPLDVNRSPYSDTIEVDLSARDFTINAIAFSLNRHEVIDPHDGLSDIENKTLRAVGDPVMRLQEDPLRVLRAIRFGPAQGRTIESLTANAIREHAMRLSQVSVERIQVELTKILISSHPASALREMQQLGLLEFTIPEFIDSVGFEQNEYHKFDVFEHTLAVIENCPADPVLRWTALFHDIGKPASFSVGEDGRRHFFKHEHISTQICKSVMKRLKFSNEMTETVSRLVRFHMRPFECGAPGVRRLLRDIGDDFDNWLTFKQADAAGAKFDQDELGRRVNDFLEMVETERNRKVGSVYSELAVNGHDLIGIGIQPGPQLGKILAALWDSVIEDPENNSREILIAKAAHFRDHGLPDGHDSNPDG